VSRSAKLTALRGWTALSTAKARAFLGWFGGASGGGTQTTVIFGSCYLVEARGSTVLSVCEGPAVLSVVTGTAVLKE